MKHKIQVSLAFCILDYGVEDEIQEEVLNKMEVDIREKMLVPDAQSFIGWICKDRGKVYVCFRLKQI